MTASYNLFVVLMLKLMYLTLQRPEGQRANTDGLFHRTYKVLRTFVTHAKSFIPYVMAVVWQTIMFAAVMFVCLLTTQFLGQPPGQAPKYSFLHYGFTWTWDVWRNPGGWSPTIPVKCQGSLCGIYGRQVVSGTFPLGVIQMDRVYIYIYIIPLTFYVLAMAMGLFVTAIS